MPAGRAGMARSPALSTALVLLRGPLGAGKTTFSRHLLQALGVQGRIKSPTYALMESYRVDRGGQPLDIAHFDFYRFQDPQEWEDAGFRDVFAAPGLKLCEWPEQVGSLMPLPDLSVWLRPAGGEAREVSWQAHTAVGEALVHALPD